MSKYAHKLAIKINNEQLLTYIPYTIFVWGPYFCNNLNGLKKSNTFGFAINDKL
jgi:hypothetical protein